MHKLIFSMFKFIGSLLLIFILLIIFITPARDYMNNLFYKDKKNELNEEQIIGKVYGYNPYVEEMQRILKDVGFEPGPIDGIMGSQTRAVLRKFQKEKGIKPTGKIDSATQLALNREKEITKQSLKNEPDLDVKEEIYIQDEVLNHHLKSEDKVIQIQIALKKAGFYKGKIDGRLGPQTRKAIIAFQKAKGLKPDGIVGSKTWEELNKYLKD